jgi:hypothetical protein
LGETRLLWEIKVGREQTAVGNEGWKRTHRCGKRRLEINRLLWEMKVGRDNTVVENEGWKRTDCCGK